MKHTFGILLVAVLLSFSAARAGDPHVKGKLKLSAALPCSDGGYLLSATAREAISLQTNDGTWLELGPTGESDALLLRFERSGRVAWVLRARGPNAERGGDLVALPRGKIVWSGRFALDLTLERFTAGSPKAALIKSVVSGQEDDRYPGSSFVVRLSATGALESHAALRNFEINAIEATRTGVVVLGSVDERAVVIPGRKGLLTLPGRKQSAQGLIAALDPDCKAIWASSVTTAPNSIDLAAVSSGSVYVGGSFMGEGRFSGPVGKPSPVYATEGAGKNGAPRDIDAFLVSFDSKTGELRWSAQIKGKWGSESLGVFGDRVWLVSRPRHTVTYRRGKRNLSTFEPPTGGSLLSVSTQGTRPQWEAFPIPQGVPLRVIGPSRVVFWGVATSPFSLGDSTVSFGAPSVYPSVFLAELHIAPLRLGRVAHFSTGKRKFALTPLLGDDFHLIGAGGSRLVLSPKATRRRGN